MHSEKTTFLGTRHVETTLVTFTNDERLFVFHAFGADKEFGVVLCWKHGMIGRAQE